MAINKSEFKALALDLYNNKNVTFSKEDGTQVNANDALRTLLLEKCGGEFTYRNFRKIENEFYEILEVLISANMSEVSREIYSQIMDFKDTELGQKPEFTLENEDLFEVSVMANGTDNLYRQRIQNRKLSTMPFDLGVEIYEELDAFLLGTIDWNKLIERVILSFNAKIGRLIGQTFAGAYDSINAEELKCTGAIDKDKLLELVEKVGDGAVIYGTKMALAKIPGIEGFVTDNTDIRNLGYVKMFNGVKCVELNNHYDKATKKFLLPNDTLYVIPEGNKILYGGFEGDARIIEDTSASRLDRQIEYKYIRKFHLGISVANRFGAYKITG